MTDVWQAVHAERAALAADLDGLGAEQWATPSLCAHWTVHDVLAHLVATAETTRRGFVLRLAAARFDFHRFTAEGVARCRAADPADTLARFRADIPLRATPPAPLESRLVEAFVHGEDIRRPLGLRGHYPVDDVVRALELQVGTPETFGGGKARVAGLRLVADDAGCTLGTGPEVAGPAVALLLAVCGRDVALGELHGPGVEILTARASTG